MNGRFEASSLVRISSQAASLPARQTQTGLSFASVAHPQGSVPPPAEASTAFITNPLGDFSQQTGAMFG